jgi:hypothetical protein
MDQQQQLSSLLLPYEEEDVPFPASVQQLVGHMLDALIADVPPDRLPLVRTFI